MADFDLALQTHFKFQALFNQLGWDQPPGQQLLVVEVDDHAYALDVIAHKRGVQVLHCSPDADGRIPKYAVRQKIDRKVTAEAREHLIIFTDAVETTQVWQWVARAPGRPNQYREVRWNKGESAELLRQKLNAIAFTIEDEELLLVTDITRKLAGGFDRDKVTKKFYTEFDKQRLAFTDFIAGIPHIGKDLAEDQRWYAAVLIDRLLFLWFLQEKGFLDDKKNYLQQRLQAHAQSAATQSFYRTFLCPLFSHGFAEQRTAHNRAALEAQFGKVPYLNGGLFAEHELERRYGKALDVDDAAFTQLFDFFDTWDWHLDDRQFKSDKEINKEIKGEINPDVLGYIFEKFVNQKQMGAYYTKEDITDYIGKNTIIPCLLAKVRAEHPKAFDELAWSMLKESGDTYIYPAMLKGVDIDYPADIANGLDVDAPDLLDRRKSWNKRANDATSLPTEIWRETITRHQRAREVRAKIAAGELRDVSDLITYNLDIRLFAQQLIERCTDKVLLKSFWFALAGRLPQRGNEKYRHGLSVLDPTCGSGAFLLAALNILKPLYDASLRAMHAIRNDALIAGVQSHPETWKEIDAILARFATNRPDRVHDYAVTKHIIVNNLYGVDIEEQATEIAKLRLFLKLVALLEPGDDIEPLPDIDFNIRHGNTLIGYATEAATERAVRGATQGNLFSDAWEDIRIRLARVEQEYNNFQLQQVQHGGHVSIDDKNALETTLSDLEETLNYHLAKEYGIDPHRTEKYERWKASHQPFHWYVDFYPLMASGGFDAVIGNPPYVEMSEVDKYSLLGYETARTGNLYANTYERSLLLANSSGFVGEIIPVSCLSTARYVELGNLVRRRGTVVASHFNDRPAKLFDGLEHIRLTVLLSYPSVEKRVFCSSFYRWLAEERATLFNVLCFENVGDISLGMTEAKVGSPTGVGILRQLSSFRLPLSSEYQDSGQYNIFYTRKLSHFLQVLDTVPILLDEDGTQRAPSELKNLTFNSQEAASFGVALLNSSLFFWFFTVYSDCRNVNRREIDLFPSGLRQAGKEQIAQVVEAASQLMNSLQSNSKNIVVNYKKHGQMTIQNFFPRLSKLNIDRIDRILASIYLLSDEQLDYIVNHDIKYRLGQSVSDD